MRELTLIGLDVDGKHIICEGGNPADKFLVRVDDRLRAAVRGDRAGLVQTARDSEVKGVLRPKDIQSRIRAGASVEEVAESAGDGADVGAAGNTAVGNSSNSNWATGATIRSGRSNSGSMSSLAASSIAVTVPPCAPGVNRKCANVSESPARQHIRTVQRPSSVRQASQSVASELNPRSASEAVMVSSRVSTAGPSARIG